MAQMAWRQPPLTKGEEDDLFLLLLADDEENASWMVMGDLQFWSASGFAHSLRAYARRRGLPWYVASMLPIEYRRPRSARLGKLAPDTFVAFVPDKARTFYDQAAEGQFPPFVLEVVSPSSVGRDQHDKRTAYALLGAREYALFTPREGRPSTLAGYRRDADGAFEPWPRDDQGRLWSEVLGLYLVARGTLLHAVTEDGELLLSPEETEAARAREETGRVLAEGENARLRRRLARYEDPEDDGEGPVLAE